MTVTVSFVIPSPIAGVAGSGVGINRVRVQERLTVGNSTAGATLFGDVVIVGNSEAGMIAVAYGTTPDAAATTENLPTTSAGFPIGPGQIGVPLQIPAGNKINAKAIP